MADTVEITDSNFQEEVLNSDMPVLIDFWADWEWKGWLRKGGSQISQIFEGGEPFEKLIDHPGYIDFVTRFVGDDPSSCIR